MANIINLNKVDFQNWVLEPGNVYIGRQTPYLSASKWANPYPMGPATRSQVIHRFVEYILINMELLESLSELKGKKLGCWCAPLQCHGEILHKLAGNSPIYQSM